MPTQTYEPWGGARSLLLARDSEVCIAGPAGTGKSVAALYKAHLTSLLVPDTMSLILRQTHASLTASTLVTFEQQVAALALAEGTVRWFGGSGRKPPAYEYSNGSRIIVGGLDQPGKFLSMDISRVYLDEANQTSIVAHETLLTRLRGRADTYRQIVLMTNPDHPAHWIKERVQSGQMRMIPSYHRDNPYLYNRDGTLTEVGIDYMARLDALTGVRRSRYRDGIWSAAEGQVYDDWNEHLNLVDPFPVPQEWRVVWTVDFGYSNSFVWQQWRIDDDGRAYLTHEIARRQRLVEDHARDILELMKVNGWKRPEAIVCDHDSEDRATLERHLGMPTTPARKGVSRGVQLTQSRIRPAGDGRPRLLVFRDALLRTDPLAALDKRPRGFAGEVGGYVWAMERGTDGIPKEAPLKLNDHSCLVAGTMIATEHGDTPIEAIVSGTRVWTRNGLKHVTASGMTSLSESTLKAGLSNGATLIGTDSHPVWVLGEGWKRMDALRYGDTLLPWITAKSLSSTALSTVDTPTRHTQPVGATTSRASQIEKPGSSICTQMSGRTTTVPSRMDARFTTPTSNHSTTNSVTWFASLAQSIGTFIVNVVTSRGMHQNESNIWPASSHSPKSGTSPKRVVNGIVNMQRHKGSVLANYEPSPASSAVGRTKLQPSTPPVADRGSVPTTASQLHGVRAVLMTNTEHANSAENSSPPTDTASPNAVGASVQVLDVSRQEGKSPVYNLTVHDSPEFFANGILVHNCDAGRYLVAYLDWHEEARVGNPAKATTAEPSQSSRWSLPVGR